MPKCLTGAALVVTLYLLSLTAVLAKEDDSSAYNRVHLSTDASTQVENDTLAAVLYSQREGTELPALANEVNQIISKAVKMSKQVANVDVQTLGYQTNAVHDKQRLSGWRVRQSIRLESKDSARLSKLIGDLQSTLAVESIDYSVSPEKLRETQDRLITEAINAFSQRAKLITGQFGRGAYRLVEINVNTGFMPIQPLSMRGAEMPMQALSAPAIEAGKQEIQITVIGTIEMQLQ